MRKRMFPSLNVQINNLESREHYCILLEMVPAIHCRNKYTVSGGWVPAGTEEAQSPQRFYLHPESPATGDYWMAQPVSFGRVKLTNTPNPPEGQIVLSSMHRYQPRIIIAKTMHATNFIFAPTKLFTFSETQFIAVTAYQNERITKLKIDNNPFAKGFRVNGQSKCKRKRTPVERSVENETAQQPKVDVLPPQKPEIGVLPPQKTEIDRVCSSFYCPASETQYQHGRVPICIPSYSIPYSYNHVLTHRTAPSINMYPYYYPRPIWDAPLNYQQPFTSLPAPEDLTVHAPASVKKKPKKLTDFSIRAITGCL
ncbi:hypothetical protein NQ314_019189 [Rhamnusium bicolor]|uniref:T-box domain-containing protein n=1 Tax=Rhamnusium bicolor TaxID=1586634 RepID=A0AAV8WNF7_9CUCU|nr:hypothetical protein NQ314_019189 [Rhamnusium bicolor]